MTVKERSASFDSAIGAIEQLALERIPVYKLMDPKDRAREMQKAVFGDDAAEVSQEEASELIDTIRSIRPWLREHGESREDHPSFRDTGHEIYWLEEQTVDSLNSVSFEPRPWEQSAGYSREAYPKFSVVTWDS